MAVKKAETVVAEAPKKAAAPRKCAAKKAAVEIEVNTFNVGFRAGDVYQALAAAGKPLTVAEVAKQAKITMEETYLGIGWLMKEGKVEGEKNIVRLA